MSERRAKAGTSNLRKAIRSIKSVRTCPGAWGQSTPGKEEGAIAALQHDKLTSVSDWCIEKALHWQEKYNGWGYFYRGIPSPYVWGATSNQRPGKYVSDGVWSPST